MTRDPSRRSAQMREPGRPVDSSQFKAMAAAHMRLHWHLSEGIRVETLLREAAAAVTVSTWNRLPEQRALVRLLAEGGKWDPALWAYPPVDFAEARVKAHAALRAVRSLDHPMSEQVQEAAARRFDTVNVFERVRNTRLSTTGHNTAVTEWALSRWGQPTALQVETAHRMLAVPPTPVEDVGRTDAGRVAAHIERVLKRYTAGWGVEVRPMTAGMAVCSVNRTVRISEDIQVSPSELARLVAHEIGAHVFRTYNASRAPGSLAWLPLGEDATETEEGLAVWWEHVLGVAGHTDRLYAARVLGVHVALSGSIQDVVEAVAPSLGSMAAAKVAIRVKRGMGDPTLPGALTKDCVYASGYDRVRTLIAHRGPDVVPALMATKWGLSCLPQSLHLTQEGFFGDEPLLLADPSLFAGLPGYEGRAPRGGGLLR